MTLNLEIPATLESRLQIEAAQNGLTPEDFVRQLLTGRLTESPERQSRPNRANAAAEEWLRAFNHWMDSHDQTLPPLTGESLSREVIYGERG